MRTPSDKKFKTEEVPTSREMFTAETVRTASHVMIAGNALLSAHLSPLLVSSLNSLFSTLATSITYGRTPEKIQSARLKDLQTLIINIRPLFEKPEMPIFFAKSTSYQTLKKQFEMLDKKYSARIESESKTFRYLMLAVGLIGSLYFSARLLQENLDSGALTWIEATFVISIMSLMGYSNVHSHRELVMCSRKDYQEFVQVLILFNTQVVEEIPILRIMSTLEQTKKEMESCEEELRELVVETSEEGNGVEESKGDEKILLPQVESKLQSLMREKDRKTEKIQQQKETKLQGVIASAERIAIEQQAKKDADKIVHEYQQTVVKILDSLKKLQSLQIKCTTIYEEFLKSYEEFEQIKSITINSDALSALETEFLSVRSLPEEETTSSTAHFGISV